MNSSDRRTFLWRLTWATAGLFLSGCDRLTNSRAANTVLDKAEFLNLRIRNALFRKTLATEYSPDDISTNFRANGSINPDSDIYQKLAANGFVDWRLQVGGLVDNPLELSLADLRQLPARTQITRHDCVEGWSCIAKWRGVQLKTLLDQAGLKTAARYIAFFCADELEKRSDGAGQFYETIDLDDAYHPQTILAYEMNDQVLPIAHGAPLRLRLERQLGYKMAKYVMRIEAIDSFAKIGLGKGGFWEDRGYQWYAGI